MPEEEKAAALKPTCDTTVHTIRILPFKYFLRTGFNPQFGGTTPEGVYKPKNYAGEWFENANLVEGPEREMVVDPDMNPTDFADSLALLLSDKFDWGCEFKPDGLYKEQSPGASHLPLQPRILGLYAEKFDYRGAKPGKDAGKREDIFIPLTAILKNPAYCTPQPSPRRPLPQRLRPRPLLCRAACRPVQTAIGSGSLVSTTTPPTF
eukprot:COSAG05_NODE_3148_length_2286_cov_2.765889_2_plen_207_part_00